MTLRGIILHVNFNEKEMGKIGIFKQSSTQHKGQALLPLPIREGMAHYPLDMHITKMIVITVLETSTYRSSHNGTSSPGVKNTPIETP